MVLLLVALHSQLLQMFCHLLGLGLWLDEAVSVEGHEKEEGEDEEEERRRRTSPHE